MSKPVICFDFDGTLVDKNGRCHPRDVEILKHENRVVFVPATGRPLSSVRHAFEQNGLDFEAAIPFPMILQNGAVVYLPREQLFMETPFSVDVQTSLLEIPQRYPQVCCLLFGVKKLEIMRPNSLSRNLLKRFDLDVELYETANQRYTKIMYLSDSESVMRSLSDEIRHLPVEASFSLPTVFELTVKGIDKGQVLSKLLISLGLEDSKIIAAGDGENDLPLFNVADISFCPTNSPIAIKKQAKAEINIAQLGLLTPMLIEAGIDVPKVDGSK